MKGTSKLPPNDLLRQARLEIGWSQPYLAERIGTTPISISRWENGQNSPSPYFRRQRVEALGKTLAELGLSPGVRQIPGIHNIPHARNPFFTGREQLLVLLHERLSATRATAQAQPLALSGLGGVGKTQTAIEYVYRYGDEYTHAIWVWAASRETLVAHFLSLAELLHLPEKDGQDQRRGVEAVKDWLATNDGWLLVMDNADDLSLVQEFLPVHHKGSILLTTRSHATGTIATNIEVEKLSLSEGTLLLLRQAKLLETQTHLDQMPDADRTVAEHIVQAMDGLPLALMQAGAYIEEIGCSLAGYLDLYSTHHHDLLARRSKLSRAYSETVATTWLLSFQHIEKINPTSVTLLRFCAFLAPDAIPEELLLRGLAAIDDMLPTEALSPFKYNQALETLLSYSLVRRNGSTSMLGIHRLVQVVLRKNMDQQTRQIWAERTVKAVHHAFPQDIAASSANHHWYLPHVEVCTTLIQEFHLHFLEAAHLLFRAGAFLYFRGFYQQSLAFHQQALAIREQALISDQLAIAESLNALALLFRIQGNYQQAETFHRRALAIREKELGIEHLVTAESFNNLGVLYRTQQQYEQAERFLQQASTIRSKALGSHHPRTLMAFINLAKLYLEQHKYDQAEQLLWQTFTSFEQALEPDHLLMAQNLALLAKLSYQQSKNEQAEMLWKQALTIIENALGPEHPALAEILNDLAELHFTQGSYLEARSLCARALDISERTLGTEHPDSLAYHEHLDRILSKIKA
jgi:tetratricopeptide (TPR) repeat protein/transcriptional regulator with XRE-family HTH domain